MFSQLNKKVLIGDRFIGNGFEPYIIAEMACAHDGDFEKAKQLIDATVASGANATQLQFFNIDHVVTPVNELLPILQKVCFSEDEWRELFDYAKSKNIDVLVCTYDVPSVKLAVELGADGIKLNSADLSNPEVVLSVAESGIPFTLGTGASTLEEIHAGLQTAIRHGAKDIILMHGVQNFPTQIEDLNISRVELLKEVFGIPIGYHDHVAGNDSFGKSVDLIAIGLGANIIEKHICMDRSAKGLDYQAALEPNEFSEFVKTIHLAYTAYGSKAPKAFTESDLKYRKFQKKSIIAVNELREGHILTREDVIFSRNNEPGLAPIFFEKIKGKKLKRSISAYENILKSDVEE